MTLKNFFQENRTRMAVVFICFLGVLCYARVLSFPFVHDDILFIEKNPQIRTFDLKAIFLSASSAFQDNALANVYYRPFLEVVYRVQFFFFGTNPAGYHAFNLFIHILNSLLVYGVVRLLYPRGGISALAAATLFCVHPVQTEAVACISGMSNLLVAFFGLLVFILYVFSGTRRHSGAAPLSYAAAGFFFLVALFTKEQAVVIPLLLFLYEVCFYPAEDGFGRKVWRLFGRMGLFGFILAGYFLMRRFILHLDLGGVLVVDGEFWLRLLAIPRSLLTYLSLVFWPHDLHYYRNVDILLPWRGPALGCALLLFIFWGATLLVDRVDRRKIVWFGWGWFGLTLLPMLNIVPLVNEFSFIFAAEHFLYFSLVGLIIFSLGVFAGAARRWPSLFTRRVRRVVAMGVLAGLTGMTFGQNRFWASEIDLFRRTVKFERNFGRGHYLLAKAYYLDGQNVQAVQHYRRALDIFEGYLAKVQVPQARRFYLDFTKKMRFDLAHAYEALGLWLDAIEAYQAALVTHPDDPALHENLGAVYLRLGRFDAALQSSAEAARLAPDDPQILNNLAVCYLALKKTQKSQSILEILVREHPDFLPAQQNLSRLLAEKEKENLLEEKK